MIPPSSPDAALAGAEEMLRSRFGHERFMPGQTDSLRSILAGRSVLVVMPTGSGKSLLYQLPALMDNGLTIVVSPLIALMKDQVDDLARRGIPAAFVNSSLGLDEQKKRLAAAARGELKLMYVAPERFRNPAFLAMLAKVKVARLAVDEAHCISQWGHDFRPDYLRLERFREQIGRPPVTALTATATTRVQHDIIASLGLAASEIDVNVQGFDRPNLALSVVYAPGKNERWEFIANFLNEHDGTGIIYVGTRKVAEELASDLKPCEPQTGTYHAGLEPEQRSRAQERFLSGKDRIVVATVAFGMGIDKPDVRFVIHYNYPASIEHYYQEIGRAGRDGLPSECVLLYSPADRKLREFFIDLNYPTPAVVQSVYEFLFRLPDNPVMLTYKQIGDRFEEKLKDGHVGAAIRLLDQAGVTRAFSGEPAVAITIASPGAEIMPKIKGPNQRAVFEAFSLVADLEVPGRYQAAMSDLCRAAGLDDEQVRRALLALDHEKHLGYEPPFRGRGIEKFGDPPPFHQLSIDWDRQQRLRGAEFDKLEAMEDFIHAKGCRRQTILSYFGEKRSFRCGICDRCGGSQSHDGPPAETRSKPDRTPRPDAPAPAAEDPRLTYAVLLCVKHLKFPVGKTRIAQTVLGSKGREILSWGLDRNPAYATVNMKMDAVVKGIEDLTRRRCLKQTGEKTRPVLELTDKGAEVLAGMNAEELLASPEPKRPASKPAREPTTKKQPTAADLLADLVDRIVAVDADRAKALLDDLRLFHPRAIALRLERKFDDTESEREQARAVWAAGELAEHYGLEFLLGCARHESPELRRLAVVALAKVARTSEPTAPSQQIRQALSDLCSDPATPVAKAAARAMEQFD